MKEVRKFDIPCVARWFEHTMPTDSKILGIASDSYEVCMFVEVSPDNPTTTRSFFCIERDTKFEAEGAHYLGNFIANAEWHVVLHVYEQTDPPEDPDDRPTTNHD